MTESRDQETSLHLRAARGGSAPSLDWLVGRFSPLLLAQARHRIAGVPGLCIEPEDLVQETWAAALPRLHALEARDGRLTPVLVRFLAATQLNLVNNLMRKRLRRGDAAAPEQEAAASSAGPSRALARREDGSLVLDAILTLDPVDRALVVLRAIEGLGNAEAARQLSLGENAASLRYNRALAGLRARLGGGVFDEL